MVALHCNSEDAHVVLVCITMANTKTEPHGDKEAVERNSRVRRLERMSSNVNASNYGLHVNFGFSPKELIKRRQNEICRIGLDFKP